MKEQIYTQKIEQALENEKHILEERLNNTKLGSKGSSSNPNRADLARSYQENFRSKLLIAQDQEILTAVNQALRRIKDGTYGQCAECGHPIQMERLEAMPSVSLCIRCQQKEN